MKRTINFIGGMHRKNEEGATLFKDFNVEFNGPSRDVVVNTDKTIGVTGSVTIYGPHFDLDTAVKIEGESLNLLSEWLSEYVKQINPKCDTIALPFPVNTEKFKPSQKDGNPIIYFKRRDRAILTEIYNYVSSKYENVRFFDYESGYNESEYLHSCTTSSFCIWIGSHESQGFALQECLSCDTPILVIDVDSLYDEIDRYGRRGYPNGESIKATSASYFDERCGLKTDVDSWEKDFDVFIENLEKYSPRSYVLENLSAKALGKKWLNFIQNFEK